MKRIFINFLIVSLLSTVSLKCYSENAITFVNPSLSISFPKQKSIIQFFNRDSSTDESGQKVAIYIQVPDEGNKYYDLYVGTIESAYPGTSIEIVSVFLNNVDDSNEDELFIIAASEIYHAGANTEGTEYYTHVFKHPGNTRVFSGLTRLTEIEKIIGGGFEGKLEGKRHKAPYVDVAGVRRILKKQGLLK